MPLLRPQVLGPLSELSRTIRISGVVDGATVTIASIGVSPRVLVSGTPGGLNDRLTLPAGVHLRPDDLLVAMQERGADKSPDPSSGMPLAVTVQRGPRALAELGQVHLASTPWECGRHVSVDGGVPGATAEVLVGGVVVGSGEFRDTEGARFALTHALPHSTTISVRQSVPALGAGPTEDLLSLTLPGHVGDPVPAAGLDVVPLACESAVHVGRVFDGAEVILTRSDGRRRSEVRSGFDAPSLWFPLAPPLVAGESLTVRQEVDPVCKRTSIELLFPVQPARGVPTPRLGPLCTGAPLIHVEDLIPGAPVRILLDGQAFDTQAPRDNTAADFPVDPPLAAGTTVAVQQSQCSVFGSQAVTSVSSTPFAILPPTVIGPLFDCVTEVPLAGVHPGTVVQVFSQRHGAISGFVSCQTSECSIHVAPALQTADKIFVEASVCNTGGFVRSNIEPVQPATELTAPRINTPLYIGGTIVFCTQLSPGARLFVQVIEATTGAIKRSYSATATFKGVATITLDDPLVDGDAVTARQALCGDLSKPASTTVTLLPIANDWWVWDPPDPLDADWNRDYAVAGTFKNEGTTPLSDVHFSFFENSTSPGDASPGFVGAGQSTRAAFPVLRQSWSWITPGVWVVHGPASKTFLYRVEITAKDQNGHPYPLVNTDTHLVTVRVSAVKQVAGGVAMGGAIVAAALLAAAVAAAATIIGLLGPAEALLVAAGAAYAAASIAAAVALDPPAPDPNFRQRVLLPAAPEPDPTVPPDLRPLVVLLNTVGHVAALNLLMSTIEGRWLGALAANETDWALVQAQDFAHARSNLAQRAATAPTLHAQALPGLLPIVQRLLPVLGKARQDLLVQGIPSALVRGSTLSPEVRGGLNLVAHSTELAYPDVDPVAALAELAGLTEEFGAAVAATPPLQA
jgi:hypothetical protein